MKCVHISETFANLVMDKYTFHTDCKSSAQHLTYCRVSVGSLILSNYFEKKTRKTTKFWDVSCVMVITKCTFVVQKCSYLLKVNELGNVESLLPLFIYVLTFRMRVETK